MKQQGDDVASWWPWNVFEVLVSCYGDVMEPTLVSVKWLSFTNRNSDEAQTSEHVEDLCCCISVSKVSGEYSELNIIELMGLTNDIIRHQVLGQMTYPVASLTPDNARSYVMQVAPFTQGAIPSIPIGGSISLEGFLSSILLLVVIIVMVLIVAVILVVVVIAIVGVVIVIVFIGIVVVGGVSSIFKLSFVIIGVLRRIVFYYLLHQPLSYGRAYAFHQDRASLVRVPVAIVNFGSSSAPVAYEEKYRSVRSNREMRPMLFHLCFRAAWQCQSVNQLVDGSQSSVGVLDVDTLERRNGAILISRDEILKSIQFIKCQRFGYSPSAAVNLTGDEDPTDEDGDTEMGDLTGVLVYGFIVRKVEEVGGIIPSLESSKELKKMLPDVADEAKV
ncbi:hypothetical protein Tco_1081379 [Tanacetum coccineum]|uniref:Uncharacterized protein n=1 Tax=Tanacetum coccineum TaxID=301880 RepID=A0ABQ5HYP2_9ASTR